jgi:hypothetical protein
VNAQLFIEATPRDGAAVLAILPENGGREHPMQWSGRLSGEQMPGPEGATVRYEGMVEYRGADIHPVMQFLLDTGAGVSRS